MKPFVRFQGHDYYPGCGFRDFIGAFSTLEEAKEAHLKHSTIDWLADWTEIYDISGYSPALVASGQVKPIYDEEDGLAIDCDVKWL